MKEFMMIFLIVMAVWLLFGFTGISIIVATSCKEDNNNFWEELKYSLTEEKSGVFLVSLGGLFTFVIVVVNELYTFYQRNKE